MKVYLARVIPAFVMYCVNGAPRSSLLMESTDSTIESADYMIIRFICEAAREKGKVVEPTNM